MVVIDNDLQDHFGHFDVEFLEIWLVCVITCNGFELESPNLHQICILGFSQLLFKMEVMDLDLQGIWPSFRFKKLHSTLLLYTELGRPRGAARPKLALVHKYSMERVILSLNALIMASEIKRIQIFVWLEQVSLTGYIWKKIIIFYFHEIPSGHFNSLWPSDAVWHHWT